MTNVSWLVIGKIVRGNESQEAPEELTSLIGLRVPVGKQQPASRPLVGAG